MEDTNFIAVNQHKPNRHKEVVSKDALVGYQFNRVIGKILNS